MQENKELFRLAYLARRWWWLIALGAVLAVGASYVVTKRIVPTYEASARLFVNVSSVASGIGSSNDPTQYGLQLASALAQEIDSYRVVQLALSHVEHPSLTANDLLARLQTSVDPSTPIVTVAIRDSKPGRAAILANALANAMISVSQADQAARYSSLVTTIQAQIAATTSRVNAATRQLRNISSRGNNAAQIDALTAQVNTLQPYLNSLNTQLNTILLSEAQSSTNLTIIEHAQAPTRPVSPSLLRNLLLALVLGLLLSSVMILAIEYLDTSLKSPEYLEERLKVSVLATVARVDYADSPIHRSKGLDKQSEAFKVLRTNIHFTNVDRPPRVLLITSPRVGEGKSTVAANYALAVAQNGQRVVLVDADLRRPTVHKLFKTGASPGLTDVLRDPALELSVLRDSGVENLRLVTSGSIPPNPSELLGSQRMSEFLHLLGDNADMLILDSPPFLAVSDALVLTSRVDGIVLVLDMHQTSVGAAMRTLDSLKKVDTPLLGVVANRLDAARGGYGDYYYTSPYDTSQSYQGKA